MDSLHFENKDPLTHVLEKKADGALSFSEAHGAELPGHFSAGADAARETAVALLLLSVAFLLFSIPPGFGILIAFAFSCGWIVWKGGRSAWLGWARLERIHRTVEQEKYEIEHHREQEKEELTALYKAKGFEGQLLEDAVNVLMADQNRLLKVMLEEELGISLHAHEHPLKQAVGAFLGSLIAAACCLIGFYFSSFYGILIASLIVLGVSAGASARYEKNAAIPAIVWTLALGTLSLAVMYFILKMLIS